MALTLTATSPDGNYSATLHPVAVMFDAELGDPSTLTMDFESHYSLLSSESTASNPLQLNSSIVIDLDGTTLFKGYVFSRELIESGGEQVIRVSCLDPMGKLQQAVASYGGNYVFTVSSPELALTEIDLERLPVTTGLDFYPAYDEVAAYLNTGDENTTTLGANIADGVTTDPIKAEQSFNGMAPSGFIVIGTEWIYYDGYNEATNGYWYFYGIERGALGSTPAAHAATATITQRTPMRIHPAIAVKLERREDGGDWEVIPEGDYTVGVQDGVFSFYADPLADPYDDFGTMRATYSVFDEDDASTLILGTFLSNLLKQTAAVGGPGLAAEDVNVDIDEIRVTRIRLDEPTDTHDVVTRLLNQLGFAKGADTDTIGYFYDHSTDKINVKNIVQQASGSEDYVFLEANQIDSDYSLEELYSAILVVYQDPRPVNLTGPDMVWHWKTGDSPNGEDDIRDTWWLQEDQSGLGGWLNTTDDTPPETESRRFQTGRLFDGYAHTGIGSRWEFDVDPCDGDPVDMFWFWFGSAATAATAHVDEVTVYVDARSTSLASGDAEPFDLEIIGVQTLTAQGPATATAPVTGGEVRLGGGARLQIDGSEFGNIDGTPHFVINAKEIGEDLQGLIFRYRGASYETAGKGRGAHMLIKEVRVTGRQNRAAFISITDAAPEDDPTELYAPDSYAKLFDSTFGMHRVKVLKIGPSSTNAAISLGRLALQQALALYNRRTYIIDSIAQVPQLGDTVLMPDGYRGVVLAVAWNLRDGEQRLQLDVLDYETELV